MAIFLHFVGIGPLAAIVIGGGGALFGALVLTDPAPWLVPAGVAISVLGIGRVSLRVPTLRRAMRVSRDGVEVDATVAEVEVQTHHRPDDHSGSRSRLHFEYSWNGVEHNALMLNRPGEGFLNAAFLIEPSRLLTISVNTGGSARAFQVTFTVDRHY